MFLTHAAARRRRVASWTRDTSIPAISCSQSTSFSPARVGGCKLAHVYRRHDKLDRAVHCHELGKYVPADIVECSQFSAVATLSLHRMQKIGLPIDPRPGVDDCISR